MYRQKISTTKGAKYHEGFVAKTFLREPQCPLWLKVSHFAQHLPVGD